MPDIRFKDLCFDATEPAAVAPFWGTVLGRAVELLPDGDARLTGDAPSQTVWVNRVPEPLTAKNRVHVDVRFADADAAPGTSIREPDDEIRWRVLADPEGLVYCAMGPRDDAPFGPFELVVDAADPPAIAAWWAARTGTSVHEEEGAPYAWLEGVPGFPFGYWVFLRVPEPKTVKNRVHWDVTLADATLEGLVEAGATVVRAKDDEIRWTVMADPEGNEFCVFTAD